MTIDTKQTTASSQILRSMHLDYVNDVAFDHFGRRMATCSGDRTVRVWDLDDKGDWIFHSDWQAHKGSVTRLSWAHPEFGQLLTTCGSDHVAIVWEEREGGFAVSIPPPNSTFESGTHPAPSTCWVSKAQLSEARKAVSCVQFAPRHLGLKLATGSADGFVRIYEAIDVMNLNHWPINSSIEAETDSKSELGVTSLSWCPSRFEPPTLVIGGSSGNISVYRYSDASRHWFRACLDLPSHGKGILDVSWAPNLGRSFHLIASAGKDDILKVYRIKRGKKKNQAPSTIISSDNPSDSSSLYTLQFESCQVLDTGAAQIWRCAWNVTGTVLASSGDGAVVQLWKCDFDNKWKSVSEVHGDVSGEQKNRMVE